MINRSEAQTYAALAVKNELTARFRDIEIAAKLGHLRVILKKDVSPAAKLALEGQGFTVSDGGGGFKPAIYWN